MWKGKRKRKERRNRGICVSGVERKGESGGRLKRGARGRENKGREVRMAGNSLKKEERRRKRGEGAKFEKKREKKREEKSEA